MEPIDQRITAAQLMALRNATNATEAIASILDVDSMPKRLADRTRADIKEFVRTGEGVLAAQLIHAAMLRRKGPTVFPATRQGP